MIDNETLGRRGLQIYEQQIRARVEGEHTGRIVAIDIETGDFEIADDVLTAAHRVRAKHPGVPVFTIRIGSDGVYSHVRDVRHSML